MIKRTYIIVAILIGMTNPCIANDKNTLRTKFLNNKANIYAINMRTFNAEDLNKNDIIDNNEQCGNFLNAIDRLDELKDLKINTLHVLPITPTGKLKALGTAGSVYAAENFWTINPQLIDKKSQLTPNEQAKLFIQECHNRNISVIIDLPSCGSYDLFLTHPELFIKDSKQCSIVPTDWTDVRLLNAGHDTKINEDVLNVHKQFIDLLIEIGADGVRADVATIKPYEFWNQIIKYAQAKDKEFLFLAEASDSWREPPSKYAVFTPYNKLLKAGFDGYYGSFFNIKEWNANEFIEHIKFNQKLLTSYKTPKSVILSFTTHDEVSPVILHGDNFSKMICWLGATLQYNPYTIDGFATGDDYLYSWANTKATETETDDDFYFVHRGKMDLFNFSRKPGGNNIEIKNNFKKAYQFREDNIELITKGTFIPINTNNDKVFAFLRTNKTENILVIGNLDFKNFQYKINIKCPYKTKEDKVILINGQDNFKFIRKFLHTDMAPGEIKIIKYNK